MAEKPADETEEIDDSDESDVVDELTEEEEEEKLSIEEEYVGEGSEPEVVGQIEIKETLLEVVEPSEAKTRKLEVSFIGEAEEEVELIPQKVTLSLLESGGVISILEDFLENLIILKYVIGAPVLASWDYTYKPPSVRFGRRGTAFRLFPEVDSVPNTTTPIKLQRDRQGLEILVRQTMMGLSDGGCFEELEEVARTLSRYLIEEQQLMEDTIKNEEKVRLLKIAIKKKRKQEEREERERDEFLFLLQDELDDVTLKIEIEEGFADHWETARDSQNKWKLREAESFFENIIQNESVKADLEERVTNEMQTFIKNYHLELEEQLEYWMNRYDEDIEEKENKILKLKFERGQQLERIASMEYELERRKQAMESWIKFREEYKRQTAASIQIQAWWRAQLVRKKLGPFKIKKKKKGGKKK